MNTKLLMTISAVLMAAVGIGLTFMPDEIASLLSLVSPPPIARLVLQVLGAVYFSFAMINWTARANLIGGIYSRPIAIGNLTHFLMGALALVKGYLVYKETIILVAGVIYVLLAACFVSVFFTHPLPARNAVEKS